MQKSEVLSPYPSVPIRTYPYTIPRDSKRSPIKKRRQAGAFLFWGGLMGHWGQLGLMGHG